MVIAVMAMFAFTLGEIGKRGPVTRYIGGVAVVVTFVPADLNYKGWIPASNVDVVSDFFKSTNILYLFIAGVVVGSILSMDRTVLIKGFIKFFVPLAALPPDGRRPRRHRVQRLPVLHHRPDHGRRCG
jgi:malate:Na+ symporter